MFWPKISQIWQIHVHCTYMFYRLKSKIMKLLLSGNLCFFLNSQHYNATIANQSDEFIQLPNSHFIDIIFTGTSIKWNLECFLCLINQSEVLESFYYILNEIISYNWQYQIHLFPLLCDIHGFAYQIYSLKRDCFPILLFREFVYAVDTSNKTFQRLSSLIHFHKWNNWFSTNLPAIYVLLHERINI